MLTYKAGSYTGWAKTRLISIGEYEYMMKQKSILHIKLFISSHEVKLVFSIKYGAFQYFLCKFQQQNTTLKSVWFLAYHVTYNLHDKLKYAMTYVAYNHRSHGSHIHHGSVPLFKPVSKYQTLNFSPIKRTFHSR